MTYIRGQYRAKPWAYYFGKQAELLKELMFDIEITDEQRMKIFASLSTSIEEHRAMLLCYQPAERVLPNTLADDLLKEADT